MKMNDKFRFVTMDNLEEEKKQAILNKRVSNNIDSNDDKVSDKNKHFSYKGRITTYIVIMSIFFLISLGLTVKIIYQYRNDIIEYKETSTISYKVCYENDCKSEFGTYDSEKTSTVPVKYGYQVDYSKDYQDTISYYIKAILRIYDRNNDDIVLLRKEDILFDKTEKLLNKRTIKIDTDVEIDYKKYDEIVRNYEKSHPNVKINAELEVFLFQDENKAARNVSSLVIPMNHSTYKVVKNVLTNDVGRVKMTKDFWTKNTMIEVGIIIIFLSFGLAVLFDMIKFIQKATDKKNDYNKKLLKLLREYDRIIVIARDGYESNLEREIIKVESFEELLEIKQVLQKPIIYSRVNSVKSEFIVEGEDKLYKFIMKESDV